MRNQIRTVGVALSALLVGGVVTLPIGGCGSGLRSGGSSDQSRLHSGAINFQVTWPKPDPTRLIPKAANSIKLQLFRGSVEVATPVVINKPANFTTGQTSVSVAAFTGLEVGGPTTPVVYRVVATAYPGTGATGNPQANGQTAANSISLTVNAPSASVPLTMDSTITRIDVAPISIQNLLVSRKKTLVATCFDAANNVVLVDPSSITWSLIGVSVGSLSSTTGNSVDFTGNSVGVASVKATVTEPVPNISSATVNIVVVATALADTSFPKFHADQQNTGKAGSNVIGAALSGARVWEYLAANSVVFSSPAVGPIDPVTGQFVVYVGAYDGHVYAVNGLTGTLEWRTPVATGGPIDSSPALTEDGSLFVGSQDGKLYCLDAFDGTEFWSFDTGGSLVGSPNVGRDGGIYIGTTGANSILFKINAETGAEMWRFTGAAGGIENAPAISPDGSGAYFGAADGSIYGVNTATGTLLAGWPVATGDAITNASPAIDKNGNVYIGSLDGKLYARRSNGSSLWTYDAGSPIYATPAIDTDGAGNPTAILIPTFDNNTGTDASKLIALNPASGAAVWSYPGAADPTIGTVSSSPAIGIDGTAYFGSYDGNVYAVRNGALIWKYTVGDILESSPSIGRDGTVFIGSYSGSVTAIR